MPRKTAMYRYYYCHLCGAVICCPVKEKICEDTIICGDCYRDYYDHKYYQDPDFDDITKAYEDQNY